MPTNKIIQVESLTYHYPDGTAALANVSFDISPGEKVALLGANGAGKSTLLMHLNGIIHATIGCVRIDGLPAEKKNLKTIRQKIGLVFQNPDDQLFCPTLFDDVAFGLQNMATPAPQIAQRVREVLQAVGLAGFERRSSFHLSIGEKKRAALATILAMQPDIIALDEPTANLDARGRKEIIALLRQLNQTQIIVTHDLELARELSRRAIILDKGVKIADDEINAVLSDRSLLETCGLI